MHNTLTYNNLHFSWGLPSSRGFGGFPLLTNHHRKKESTVFRVQIPGCFVDYSRRFIPDFTLPINGYTETLKGRHAKGVEVRLSTGGEIILRPELKKR